MILANLITLMYVPPTIVPVRHISPPIFHLPHALFYNLSDIYCMGWAPGGGRLFNEALLLTGSTLAPPPSCWFRPLWLTVVGLRPLWLTVVGLLPLWLTVVGLRPLWLTVVGLLPLWLTVVGLRPLLPELRPLLMLSRSLPSLPAPPPPPGKLLVRESVVRGRHWVWWVRLLQSRLNWKIRQQKQKGEWRYN